MCWRELCTKTRRFVHKYVFSFLGGYVFRSRGHYVFCRAHDLTEIVYTPWYPMVSRIIQIFDFSNLGGYASAGYCFTEKHHFSYQEGRP
jgi:hypothetical protein